jgi:hypothetical protein
MAQLLHFIKDKLTGKFDFSAFTKKGIPLDFLGLTFSKRMKYRDGTPKLLVNYLKIRISIGLIICVKF